MTMSNPEALLSRAMHVDGAFIESAAIEEAQHFLRFGECGLAYDVLVFEIEEKRYQPSKEALELIKRSAQAMNLTYPKLSTD